MIGKPWTTTWEQFPTRPFGATVPDCHCNGQSRHLPYGGELFSLCRYSCQRLDNRDVLDQFLRQAVSRLKISRIIV
jgi:hypothetical protein